MTMYERIDLIRKERGIMWSHLNEKIGAYRGKLTELKKGKTTLSQDEIFRIASVLGTSTDYLIGKTDDPSPPGAEEKPPAQGGGLSEKEQRLIHWFRSLPPETRKAILTLGGGPEDLID